MQASLVCVRARLKRQQQQQGQRLLAYGVKLPETLEQVESEDDVADDRDDDDDDDDDDE